MSIPQLSHALPIKSLQALFCPEKPDSIARHTILSCFIGMFVAAILIVAVDMEASRQLRPVESQASALAVQAGDSAAQAQLLRVMQQVGR